MFLSPAFFIGAGEFSCGGVNFDGTNDRLDGTYLGDTDSKKFTFVGWINTAATARQYILYISDIFVAGVKFFVEIQTTGELSITAATVGGVVVLTATGTTVFSGASGWKCIMISVDLSDTNKRHVYIGDSAESMTWGTYTNSDIDFSGVDYSIYIGGFEGVGRKFNGDMADLWFLVDTYIDFSVEANRRLFFSSGGEPVDLGTDGSIPASTTPNIYLHRGLHGSVASWASNNGTNAGFSVTGSLTVSTTNP